MNDFDTELNVYLEGMQAKQDGLSFKQALEAYNVKPDHLSVFYNGYSFEQVAFKVYECNLVYRFEHPETGETVFAFRHIVTGEWIYQFT